MSVNQTPSLTSLSHKRGSRSHRLAAAGFLAAGLLGSTGGAPVLADGGDAPTTARYEISVTNTTGGQYLTPPNWAVSDSRFSVFGVGHEASAGLTQLAENGGVPVLAAELVAAVDNVGRGVSGVGGAGPIGPGGTVTFTVDTDERHLSVAAMLVCTNDGFAGLDAKRLPPQIGQTASFRAMAYDAGTEINTEDRGDLVPAPVCGDGEGSGASNPELSEGGVVHRHGGIAGIGDLDDSFDWAGPVAEITVTRIG